MKQKPANLIYGVDQKPPFFENVILGLQHVSIFFVSICFPVLLVAYMGDAIDENSARGFISMSMIAAGIVTIVQSFKKSALGSGYLVPSVCGPSYLSASMAAVAAGGLPMLFGMTGFVGIFEVFLSRFMGRLRFLFPTEVTGVIVLMVGVVVIPLTMESLVGVGPHDKIVTSQEVITGLLTFFVMLGLNVYSKGKLKLYSVLIGIVFGYTLAALFGLFPEIDIVNIKQTPWFAFPHIHKFGWAFDTALIIPFVIAAVSSTLKTVGDISTVQKINDVNWKRIDMKSLSGGIFADGLGGVIPGLIGGFGQSTSSANIGLSIATGATSRVIAWMMGGLLIIMAFLPKVSEFFLLMPSPVIGATLLYAVSFMIIAGLQIIMSRMLDARKTFVVGVSIIFGISVYILGDVYGNVHGLLKPIFSSSLSLATISAVVLNLILRIGIRKREAFTLELGKDFSKSIFDVMEINGARWGARRDVIYKAAAALNEFMEALLVSEAHQNDKIEVKLFFDEFNFDIELEYLGTALAFPDSRPSPEEILNDAAARQNLAGYLIARYADEISTNKSQGLHQHLKLHFEH